MKQEPMKAKTVRGVQTNYSIEYIKRFKEMSKI